MVCPMLVNDQKIGECQKENCAWWCEITKQCSIKILGIAALLQAKTATKEGTENE